MVTSSLRSASQPAQRIASLAPAATEWLCAFGAGPALVGRSHACDFPPEVSSIPAVTALSHTLGDTSQEIDRAVRGVVTEEAPLYTLDVDLLRRVAPDLVVTQDQCAVCAAPAAQIREALASWERPPTVLSFEPTTLKETLDAALRIGLAAGRGEEAMRFIGNAEARLQRLRNGLGLHRRTEEADLPTVVCIEWMDPLMTASHWVPDLVALAGGRALLSRKGGRSEYIDWDEILKAGPDVIVIAPCGYTVEQTRREWPALTRLDGGAELAAVQAGRVYVMDGNAYFNRPGPRLYRTVELLALALRPDRTAGLISPPEPWEFLCLGHGGV